MTRVLPVAAVLVLCILPLPAQVGPRRAFARAAGDGSVTVRPDQMKLSVSVVTQGATAQEASDQNATRVTAVLSQLRQVVGPTGDIRTVSYSVTPNYRFPQGGGQPTLTGFTATNTVEVTSADLAGAGRLIDAAIAAGATTVAGLRFTLKDPDPARQQALRLATQQARANAEAMAGGLGLRLGTVLSVEQGFGVRPALDVRAPATGGTTTPVEPGSFEVSATVTIEAELVQ